MARLTQWLTRERTNARVLMDALLEELRVQRLAGELAPRVVGTYLNSQGDKRKMVIDVNAALSELTIRIVDKS